MIRTCGSILVVIMAMTVAAAAPVNAAITFDVDFWSTGNPTHNYIKNPDDPGDLGQSIKLFTGEQINVDIYFSTDEAYTAGSWNLTYDPTDFVTVSGTTAATTPWALPIFKEELGSIAYQSVVFPPGESVSGENIFFGSILFECTGPGDVDLNLTNFIGFIKSDRNIDAIDDVYLGTLSQEVPIPGAFWLLGFGLAGLIGVRGRKARQ